MKRNYIVSILCLAVVLAACNNQPAPAAKEGHLEPPLDSSVTALTRPVNAQVVAAMPVVQGETGTRIYTAEVNGIVGFDTRQQTGIASRVGGRIERLLVKYNYQPVTKGQLIMEVYSPDLAAAQRELLFTAEKSPGMLAGAKQRLLLLGMQPAQLEQVLRTQQIIYRVPVYSPAGGYILEKTAAAVAAPSAAAPAASAGDGMGGMGSMGAGNAGSAPAPAPAAPAASPVMLREGQYVSAGQALFTIYQAHNLAVEFSFPAGLAPHIRQGQKLLYQPVSEKDKLRAGNIGLVEPVFRNGQNFMLARVYPGGGTELKPGQLLTAYIPVMYTGGWWLPAEAVWKLGNKAVVFQRESGVFVAREVQAGTAVEGMVNIHSNITGWQVAANAAYLVDSESFIKTNNRP
jgi:multidrug efflux pump subunit AcrA (membrane-fusion protein)